MAALFALGSNGSGQLGIGHTEDVSVPKPALFSSSPGEALPKVVRVAAGGNHTLLLADDGTVYWAGDPRSGACGLVAGSHAMDEGDGPKHPPHSTFQVLDTGPGNPPIRARLLAASWEASFFTELDEHGQNTKVYSLGTGLKGELGQGALVFRRPVPSLMAGFLPPGTEVVDVSAGMALVAVVLSNGDVYAWGKGRNGQVGEVAGQDNFGFVHTPRRLESVPFKAVRVVCGRAFTCVFGDPETGDIVVLGPDKWSVKSSAPKSVRGWKDVAASWSNIFILYQDGRVESWGRDDHGQLVPPNLPPIAQIAAGSEHVVALTRDGDVVAWGWGEHGNCGPQVDDHGDVKGRWNVIASTKYIPADSAIAGIGAGCATSWITITSQTP